MPIAVPPFLMTLLLAAATAQPHLDMSVLRQELRVTGPQVAQVIIEQRVIIRIPSMPQRRAVAPAPTEQQDAALTTAMPPDAPAAQALKEVKGPKCLKLEDLRGVLFNSASGITLLTDRSEYFRTHFDRMCTTASFYAGAYIAPNKDGKICAKRDTLHARNGSSCGIESFSKLVPAN